MITFNDLPFRINHILRNLRVFGWRRMGVSHPQAGLAKANPAAPVGYLSQNERGKF